MVAFVDEIQKTLWSSVFRAKGLMVYVTKFKGPANSRPLLCHPTQVSLDPLSFEASLVVFRAFKLQQGLAGVLTLAGLEA